MSGYGGSGFSFPYSGAQEEGTSIANREPFFNFIGPDVTVTDDAANQQYDVTIVGAAVTTGWTDDGLVVRLTTATDRVSIGDATGIATAKLSVIGDAGEANAVSVQVPATTNLAFTAIVAADTNPRVQVGNATQLAAIVMGSGAAALDTEINRQAANVFELGSGDSLFSVGAATLGRRAASADANPTAAITATGFEAGAGGGSATDVTITRQAANVWEVGSGDSWFSVAAPIGRRAASADANPTAQLTGAQLDLGAGGGTAVDVTLARQAANVAEWGSGDSAFIVGAASMGRRNASADANPTAAINATGFVAGAGGASAVDVTIIRQAADVWEVGSGDSWFSVAAPIGRRAASGDANPTAQLTGSQLDLGAGGGTAVDCTIGRQAANVIEVANADSFYKVGAGNLGVRAASGDANATAQLTGSQLDLGAGGGTGVDWTVARQAANVAEMGANDTLYAVGASGAFGVRAGAGDANPTAELASTGIRAGAGGASAVDVALARQAANVWEVGDGDALYVVGAATLGRRGATGDANPTAAINATGFVAGAGGASAVDVTIIRQAADVWEVGSGDSWFAVAAPIGRRGAAGDANPTAQLTGSQLDLGAGAASAVDTTLARQAANVFETGSGDALYAVNAILGRRTASGDVNATVQITGSQIDFGAGGASVVDTTISRGAANRLDLAAGDSFLVNQGQVNIIETASGNQRRVGGSTTRTVAESAAVTGAEAAFAGGAETIAASTIAVGTAIRFVGLVRVSAVSGAPTAQVRIRLGAAGTGGTATFDTTARTVADEDLISFEGWLCCRASGGAGTMTGYMTYRMSAADTLASAAASEWAQDVAGTTAGTWTVAVDTTVARDLTVTGQTDGVGTDLNLEFFRVYFDA